ncbi:PspC family transcriptional regulator [Flammeovirgaceae bacterium SG7u.111]|nr:PspC family transcriptional regulator [Flammeovirgaceae bacterium SG7u.132]WPO34796.1 PspC family transcriptional regulator [Flammeovirgaceae bacterium SG7u.111]
MKKLQFFLEKRAFGVCSVIGETVGISSGVIRMYFIYTSFLTFGSPVIVYLALAFWLNIQKYMRRRAMIKDLI